jgi:hypothetical protein
MGISFLFWHAFFKFLEVGGLHNYCFIPLKSHAVLCTSELS